MDQPMRILIADDDRHARAGLRALLGTYPACEIVGEAVNGQDAIEQIERCRPDAVLLDVWMPVLDGLEAARMIKERRPEVAIVVLSMDSGHRAAALAAGAAAFISKADGPDQVVKTLHALCAWNGPDAGATSGDSVA
jgi:DNA-binding NarL/FixJ family response regulator